MKKILIPIILLITFKLTCAQTWCVDPHDTSGKSFASLVDALEDDKLQAGDTIYLHPSIYAYAPAEVYRKLTILPDSSCSYATPVVLGLTFNSGSEGTVVRGIFVQQLQYNVALENISVEKVRRKKNYRVMNMKGKRGTIELEKSMKEAITNK